MKLVLCQTETTRRSLFGAALATAAIGYSRPTLSQTVGLPDISETVRLLERHEGVGLIYTRFSLAYSLTTDLVTRVFGVSVDNLDAAIELPLLPPDLIARSISNPFEPFRILQSLAFLEGGQQRSSSLRDSLRSTLMEQVDPIGAVRGEAVVGLLSKVAGTMEDLGVPATEGPIADALASCAHVERIAAVSQDTDEGGSYLCRFFPFSFFC
jgi:hypothetical protein